MSTLYQPTVEEVIRIRLRTALGGLRGSLETALPMLAFVAVWQWRSDLRQAIMAAAIVAALALLLRLAQRQTVRHVLSAAFVTAIAAWFALRSGKAEDAFLPGMLTSGAYLLATVVSIVTRWPFVGFLVGAGDPNAATDPFGWRRDAGMVRVCQRLSWVLVGLYVVRLAIQIPLYLAGNVAGLGVAKIVLGWPLWAAAVAVMGAMLVRGRTPQEPPVPAPTLPGSGQPSGQSSSTS